MPKTRVPCPSSKRGHARSRDTIKRHSNRSTASRGGASTRACPRPPRGLGHGIYEAVDVKGPVESPGGKILPSGPSPSASVDPSHLGRPAWLCPEPSSAQAQSLRPREIHPPAESTSTGDVTRYAQASIRDHRDSRTGRRRRPMKISDSWTPPFTRPSYGWGPRSCHASGSSTLRHATGSSTPTATFDSWSAQPRVCFNYRNISYLPLLQPTLTAARTSNLIHAAHTPGPLGRYGCPLRITASIRHNSLRAIAVMAFLRPRRLANAS